MNTALAGAVAESRRAVVAARALWREGLIPECHAYMASGLRTMIKAWEPADSDQDDAASRREQALAALKRAGYRGDIGRLRAAVAAAAIEAQPADPAKLEWIWAEAERLSAFTIRRLTPPAARKRARIRAAVLAGIVVVAAVLVMMRLWGRPGGARVSASAEYSPGYPASFAADGIEGTEWLLPDRQPGWLQLKFGSPRRVQRVLLLNAHNRYFMDRGSERVRVTAYSEGGSTATAEGRFDHLTSDRSPLDLAINAERVVRVRVEILSYFKEGGGLADVEVY